MNWIDLKVRKPTEADEDESGRIFWRCQSGYTFCGRYNNARTDVVAWMPIPGFTPSPDPPEGYRIVDKATEPFDSKAIWRSVAKNQWYPTENEEDGSGALGLSTPSQSNRQNHNTARLRTLKNSGRSGSDGGK